jgi:hypothetical protein
MTPSNATVYMTDGTDKLIPMSSFTPVFDLGINLNIRVISDEILAKYTVTNGLLSQYIKCNNQTYLGASGVAYTMAIDNKSATELDEKTCNVIRKQDQTTRFVLAPGGTIFLLEGSILRPITSYQKYIDLQKSGGGMISASAQAISYFTIGSPL